eukprot:GHUV01008081.1.p1 GENE.GHUV01008081.1~~GHUV01008081.1.p1  ORF type:complete len:869 (+),score=299.72 GHUV01008081.1:2923-5529(+)
MSKVVTAVMTSPWSSLTSAEDPHCVPQRRLRILLSWDYFELCQRAEDGKGVYDTLQQVPNTFSSIQHYKEVFEPLLLEEAGAQVLRGIEEGVEIKPYKAVVAACTKDNDFHIARITVEQDVAKKFTDNDLVLLTKDHPHDEECRTKMHALGFMEGHEGSQSLRVKFYLTDDSQAGKPAQLERVKIMRAGVEAKASAWWVQRLFNMSTITREWVAMQHAHLMPFRDTLLHGQPMCRPSIKAMDIPPGMRAVVEQECNSSQMAALRAGLDGTPLVLIQGPPGTGKTRTILNLLSVVMHSAAKGSLELVPKAASTAVVTGKGPGPGGTAAAAGTSAASANDAARAERARLWRLQSPWMFGQPTLRDTHGPNSDTGMPTHSPDCFGLNNRRPAAIVGKALGPKARVLVCAPSNAALDEIVLRILQHGLLDGSGKRFDPSLVRIGVNVHHSVKHVSLESLVDAKLGVSEKGQVSGLQRERAKIAILQDAVIVSSTLSFAGSSIFHRMAKHFDVVIIDEAAQAVEPSVMVPLVMGCKQVYLVGDPVQLPATVISSTAVQQRYDVSMFKRLQSSGYPVNVLDVQYRMNPAISLFPSEEFYQGRLKDGEGVLAQTSRPWHSMRCFGPFAVYDVQGKEEVPQGGASILNNMEALFVLALYKEMLTNIAELREHKASVAVISPYKAQVQKLRELFAKALGDEGAKHVDINTIDGFQGREKDIVIFSCVRTAGVHHRSIGFVADERRINVGITRARCALLIIGHAASLATDTRWRNLLKSAVERDCMYQPVKPYGDYLAKLVSGEKGTAALGYKLKQLLETDEYAPAGGDYADVVYDMEMVQQQPEQAAVAAPLSGKGRRTADATEQQPQPASKRTRKK